MSLRTINLRIDFIRNWTIFIRNAALLAVSLHSSSIALAYDPQMIQSNKDALDQAYLQFFRETRKLSSPSKDQIQQLEKSIVGPASEALDRARQEASLAETRQMREEALALQKERSAREKRAGAGQNAGQNGGQNAGGLSAGPVGRDPGSAGKPAYEVTPSFESRPEVILDGKDIPKEIEFTPSKPVKSPPSGIKK